MEQRGETWGGLGPQGEEDEEDEGELAASSSRLSVVFRRENLEIFRF